MKGPLGYTNNGSFMEILPAPNFHLFEAAKAITVALAAISVASLLRNLPINRRQVNAIIVGVAAGTYVNGGMGIWELGFALLVAGCAYQGLRAYRFIGIAWLLHTGWDIVHHFTGHPMIAWLPTSSGECAITDAVLAVWFFLGAPLVWTPTPKGELRDRSKKGKHIRSFETDDTPALRALTSQMISCSVRWALLSERPGAAPCRGSA